MPVNKHRKTIWSVFRPCITDYLFYYLLGEEGADFSLVCDMYTVCQCLFALPLGVTGRLYSVNMTLPEHLNP